MDTARAYPTKVRPGSSRLVGMRLSDFQALVPYTTTKSFMRALLNPNPTRRLTAEQALSYTWLTSIAAPTEHDLCGIRENFDLRSRWRGACLSRLRNLIVRIIRQGTGWHSAPTMKMVTEAEAGHSRGARHRNQTPRDNNTICRHHRRRTVRLGVGWRDSWGTGPQNQQCHL